MNAQSPHKLSSTLKSAVFGLSSSLPPLVDGGGGWCASGLVRLICSYIILTASSKVNLLICCAAQLPSVSDTYHRCLQV